MKGHRLASTVLLAGGVIFVFGGLSQALGYSIAGLLASAAAIAALLYAGGVWFGAAPSRETLSVILYTPDLLIASGPSAGRPLVDAVAAIDRLELEIQCRDALAGRPSRMSPARGNSPAFAASPVRDSEGTVRYGLLLLGALAEPKLPEGTKRTDFTNEATMATEVNEVSIT
jgi:hypothetical protein